MRHKELTVWLPTAVDGERDKHKLSAGEGHYLESRVNNDGSLEVRRYEDARGSVAGKMVQGWDYGPGGWSWMEYDCL